MSNIFFDLETTGLGKANGKTFSNEVGIFNIAYAQSGGQISSLYGKSSVAFEKGDFMTDLQKINKSGILSASKNNRTEKDILRKFVGSMEQGDTLVGWNSFAFDSPVLTQRLRDLGLKSEATKVASMTHVDMMRKVKGHMDRLITETSGSGPSPWQFGSEFTPKGMSQGAIAAGLNIDVTAAHMAGDDVKVLREISKHSESYKAFKNRFLPNLNKWASYVDSQRTSSSMRHTSYRNAFVGKNGAGPTLEVNSEFLYTRGSNEIDKLDWARGGNKAPVEDVSKAVAKEARSLGALNELGTLKNAGILAGVTVGAAALNKVKNYFEDKGDEVPQNLRINARELGKPLYEIVNDLKTSGSTEKLNERLTAQYHTMKAGSKIGAMVEEEMSDLPNFVGSEVELEDRFLGVKGFADTVMHIEGEDRPIELKTIDDADFNKLTGPKASHAMQANFYSHALGSQKGYVMYISREDPSKRVTFDVPYDPGSLIAAVEKYRGAVYSAGQAGGHSTALEYFFGNKSGTRDQTNRSYLTGPGYKRTPREPNNSYVGSRNIPRNQ